MFTTLLFGKLFTIEFRNGFGFDLEFVDSKLVWTRPWQAESDSEFEPLPFEGTVILLPFICITYGILYREESE